MIVDRPGHGRSPFHVETMGPMGPPFSYETGRAIYFPPDPTELHTQWPFAPDDDAAMDDLIAGYGPLPADLGLSEDMEADRLARLLDRIGPAVLLTHSASGRLARCGSTTGPGQGDRRREADGSPFADIPNIGLLEWGLAAVPLEWDPPVASPAQLRAAAPGKHRLPALVGLPIVAVTDEASAFTAASGPAIEQLQVAGASAELLHLPDHGVFGNGHGLIYEKNSDAALAPVFNWLERTLSS